MDALARGWHFEVINHDIDEGVVIPWITDDGRRAYYKIYKHLVTDDAFYAYAFSPVSWEEGEKPLPELMVRGSQFHPMATAGLASVQEDAKNDPGKDSAESASKLIEKLWNDPEFANGEQQIIATSMSLSGAQVMYLAADFPWMFKKVVTYCCPGIDEAAKHKFNKYFRDNPDKSIEILHHRNFGDMVDLGGDYFLGHDAPHNVKASLTVRGFQKQKRALEEMLRHQEIELTAEAVEEAFLVTSPGLGAIQTLAAMVRNHGTEFTRRDPEKIFIVYRERNHMADPKGFDDYLSPQRNYSSTHLMDEWFDVGFQKHFRRTVLLLNPKIIERSHNLFRQTHDYLQQ